MSYESPADTPLSNQAPSVVVIGAGISGLSAAYTITQTLPHVHVHVLEGQTRAGGWVHTERDDHHVIEHGPDSLVTDDAEVFDFVRELGLMPSVVPTNAGMRRLYVVINKTLKRVPAGYHMVAPKQLPGFLSSDVLSLGAKLRAIAEPFISHKEMLSAADESVASYLIDRMGLELYKTLSEPMIRGVYGGDPRTLSLKAIFPDYAQLRDRKQSLLRSMLKTERSTAHAATGANYGKFISFRAGMAELIEALTTRLARNLRYEQQIEQIEYSSSARSWKVHLNNGQTLHAHGLVVATSAFTAANLLAPHARALSEHLNAIPYGSMLAVSYLYNNDALDRALDAFGFIVPKAENLHLLASTWSSVKYAGRAALQESLLRVYLSDRENEATSLYDMNDEAIEALARKELNMIINTRGEPLRKRVLRFVKAMPQYTLGHVERVQAIHRELEAFPTLKLCGNAYEGVGIAASIKLARREAKALCASL